MSTEYFPSLNETAPDAPQISEPIDAKRIFESVMSELEVLHGEALLGTGSQLVSLHAALLVFNLEARLDLLPTIRLSLSRRGLLEARVIRAARRLCAGAHTPTAITQRAEDQIEELLHLIDPELRARVA
jgi:hypothetical protein